MFIICLQMAFQAASRKIIDVYVCISQERNLNRKLETWTTVWVQTYYLLGFRIVQGVILEKITTLSGCWFVVSVYAIQNLI